MGGGGRMSILKYTNVACLYRLVSGISYVSFKKSLCGMSLFFKAHVACH